MREKVLPVLTVVLGILALWYLAAIPMNVREALTAAERAGAVVEGGSATERQQLPALRLVLLNPALALEGAWTQDRPRLPAPHQVAAELWSSVAGQPPGSNRSLLRHAGITLGATLAGFAIGSLAGILLAVGIVHNRAMDLSVMPWAIISQTIPIVALAPMIVVVLNSVGVQGLLPKAVISAYLSFFPVAVGMVKGLRTPDPMQIDLMRTWNASRAQIFWLLRLPASVPYLFASLKVAVAAALVGTIVGELPIQRGGLGARMLAGSYYGQTTQIWAALVMAAVLAAALVWFMGFLERRTLRAMGVPA
ncbi:ABC-type nitrate/sulfonate/bicarbonate transport system, permease component [Rubellimicrobium thermophilum DSM 16684]|uniref:ABC-type nitrate/sulfonate/bicarbonate transport system, permease component n=1 Tax=Rubellimicrobium thermophilum DSM 16684 TaxID=1123069 RepID=S9RYM9_9RHOB|nr:ABC transporter permease [Rubellimicrobium thermophilum]EPX83090.1 ABC-type nitrate/sulfonate/bicarbonate transport system, permease component [Rubellimicrobium thermophilum DSM 16684]